MSVESTRIARFSRSASSGRPDAVLQPMTHAATSSEKKSELSEAKSRCLDVEAPAFEADVTEARSVASMADAQRQFLAGVSDDFCDVDLPYDDIPYEE